MTGNAHSPERPQAAQLWMLSSYDLPQDHAQAVNVRFLAARLAHENLQTMTSKEWSNIASNEARAPCTALRWRCCRSKRTTEAGSLSTSGILQYSLTAEACLAMHDTLESDSLWT